MEPHHVSSDSQASPPKNGKTGKLFLGGLSQDTTSGDLQVYFRQFGAVKESFIKMDALTGRSRGFGFVIFVDAASTEKVLSTGPHHVKGKKLDIKAAVPKHLTKDRGLGSRKVFVGGLSQLVTEDYLEFFFAKFGNVMEVKIMFDHSTPQPHRHRGFAFVTFKDPAAADEVCRVNYHQIMDKVVEVKLASIADEPSRQKIAPSTIPKKTEGKKSEGKKVPPPLKLTPEEPSTTIPAPTVSTGVPNFPNFPNFSEAAPSPYLPLPFSPFPFSAPSFPFPSPIPPISGQHPNQHHHPFCAQSCHPMLSPLAFPSMPLIPNGLVNCPVNVPINVDVTPQPMEESSSSVPSVFVFPPVGDPSPPLPSPQSGCSSVQSAAASPLSAGPMSPALPPFHAADCVTPTFPLASPFVAASFFPPPMYQYDPTLASTATQNPAATMMSEAYYAHHLQQFQLQQQQHFEPGTTGCQIHDSSTELLAVHESYMNSMPQALC